MIEYFKKMARLILKTTAAVCAVVFLLLSGGCCTNSDDESVKKSDPAVQKINKRRLRKRSSDYSRLPGNYPAAWQTKTAGH